MDMENNLPGSAASSDSNPDRPSSSRDALLAELADRLVRMGWFTAGSPGLAGTLDFLRQAPEDQLQGLVKACERHLADPPCCGGRGSARQTRSLCEIGY